MFVYIFIGISGSGKSTLADSILLVNKKAIRINRDSLRNSISGTLDGYYEHPNLRYREELVTKLEKRIIDDAIENHTSIILDNTNLNSKYLIPLINYFSNIEDVRLSIKFLPIDTNIAKNRVRLRDSFEKLNLDYIDRQQLEYLKIEKIIKTNFSHLVIQ